MTATEPWVAESPRLRPPDQAVRQDWGRLRQWLAAQGMRLDDDPPPRQFATGLANLNYLLSVDSRPTVLRRPPAGPTAEGANDMAREWRVLTGLAGHFPLAPAPVAYCADPGVLGAAFQLMEYRPGRPIGARLPDGMSGRQVGGRLTTVLVDVMARLHRLDPALTGLGELGRPVGFLARQVAGWARRSAAAFGASEPRAVAAIVSRLSATVPEPAGSSLLHCDLKFDNMLFDLGSLEPVAVLDWDMATRGDPLFDVAVTLSYWSDPDDPEPVRSLGVLPTLEPGFPSRAGMAAAYFAVSGVEERDLRFHLALARFRLAVAWQQMYVHSRRGTLVDPAYAGFHRMALAMLDWTADTLDDDPLRS